MTELQEIVDKFSKQLADVFEREKWYWRRSTSFIPSAGDIAEAFMILIGGVLEGAGQALTGRLIVIRASDGSLLLGLAVKKFQERARVPMDIAERAFREMAK